MLHFYWYRLTFLFIQAGCVAPSVHKLSLESNKRSGRDNVATKSFHITRKCQINISDVLHNIPNNVYGIV